MRFVVDESKDRAYYQKKCYRLKEQLKEAREKLSEQKPTSENIDYKTKYYNIKHSHETQLERNKKLVEDNKSLRQQVDALKNLFAKRQRESIENKQLMQKVKTLEKCLATLTIRNKQAFRYYFDRQSAFDKEDDVKITFPTLLLDYEYLNAYQKLLEMHVSDYVIDKYYNMSCVVGDITDLELEELFKDAKVFVQGLLYNLPYQQAPNLKRFREAVCLFAEEHLSEYRCASQI